MLFTEFRFFFFFALIFGVYWALQSNSWRKAWLLVASYVFYAGWDPRFLLLIWISTAVDYCVGLGLLRVDSPRGRKWLVTASVCTNLAILGFFKYFNFFADSAVDFFQFLGLGVNQVTLQITLPVGISFFTFQTMSYSIDAYKRNLEPTRNLLDLAFFVAFFPQLVAGPIVRAIDFMPQVRKRMSLSQVEFRPLIALFLVGFFKKAVVADNAAPIVDMYFADPDSFSLGSAFVGVFAYSAQIYGDFSGYSDMAIATAGLLGFWLPLNFAHPYLAPDITQFWRRWHISLSSWLRDYLYIALGGNHGSRVFTYRNLMLTMLLGGLWHGAAWRFVIWGGLHGFALIAHREWRERNPWAGRLPSAIGTVVSTAFTLYWVSLAWIFFRASDLANAWTTVQSFIFLRGAGSAQVTALNEVMTTRSIAVALAVVLVLHIGAYLDVGRWLKTLPGWAFAAAVGVFIPLMLTLVPTGSTPFVYFQF